MRYPRKQQRMATEECFMLLLRHSLPASSATEPLAPDMADGLIEVPDALGVRPSSVALVVAPELSVEGLLLFFHGFVAVLLVPFGDRREAPSNRCLILRKCAVNFPCRLRAQMCVQPRKSNVAGFFPLPFRVFLRVSPKVHQVSLLRAEPRIPKAWRIQRTA
jgi:hypothetical protein